MPAVKNIRFRGFGKIYWRAFQTVFHDFVIPSGINAKDIEEC